MQGLHYIKDDLDLLRGLPTPEVVMSCRLTCRQQVAKFTLHYSILY